MWKVRCAKKARAAFHRSRLLSKVVHREFRRSGAKIFGEVHSSGRNSLNSRTSL
jgi:hypothetical protein